MAADLVKIVENLRDDLKGTYLQNPTAVWDLPVIAISRRAGGVNILDGIKSDEHVVAWLSAHMANDIESIVVGRMVAKYSDVVGADGKPIIKEKAIMVMGRSLGSNRAYVSITPCMEHHDLRGEKFAEEQNKVFDPTLKGADKTHRIVNEQTGSVSWLQAKFGKEQVLDTRKGEQFLVDPIIEGVFPTNRSVEEAMAKAVDLNKNTIKDANGLGL